MLQCETPVRKVMILMSLGLMTKLYEDKLCDAAVDRVDDTLDMEDESQMQADRRSEFELSESRFEDEHSSVEKLQK